MTSKYKSGISQQQLIRSSTNFKLKLREPNQNKIWLEMKTTFNGRRHQNIKSGISQFGLKFEMKTTSDGGRPQNSKSGISQQPLIGSSSNFKLKLRGPNQNQI